VLTTGLAIGEGFLAFWLGIVTGALYVHVQKCHRDP
jgi:hypothetical protein